MLTQKIFECSVTILMRVLIITEHFPPSSQVSSFRVESWYNYFPEKGITPIILTLNTASEGENVYTVSKQKLSSQSKLNTLFSILNDYVFYERSKYYPVLIEALQICENNKIDFILASGSPFQLFKVANEVSKKTGVPWIADYRDGWSTNVTYKTSGGSKKALSAVYSLFEKNIMQSASFFITASPTYKEDLLRLFPGKDIHVIFNGYIEEDFIDITPSIPRENFIITYLGTLYSYQKLEAFLKGLRTFLSKEQGISVTVNFYGLNKSEYYRLEDFRKTYSDVINIYPKMGRKEALKAAAKSNILLLLLSKDTVAVPAKTFDYIALKLPILVVENDESVIYDILKDNPNAYFANNGEEVFNTLTVLQKDTQQIEDIDISKWSRREQAYELVKLMCGYEKLMPGSK